MKSDNVSEEIMKILQRDFPLFGSARTNIERLHASDMYLFCPRKVSIMHKNSIVPASRNHSLGEKVTFGIGVMIEKLILIALKNVLIGEFKHMQDTRFVHYTAPVLEKKIIDNVYLVGHPDAVVQIGDKRVIVDIKSINGEDFNILTVDRVPLTYKYQLQTYLYLADKSPVKYHDTAYLIFVSKKHNQSPIKIIGVKLEPYVKKQFNKHLKELKEYYKTGSIPERLCMRDTDIMARQCNVLEICFKGGRDANKQAERKKTPKKDSRKNRGA